MPNTPLWLCHQCRKPISRFPNPWTFHARRDDGGLDDVVRFCSINCIAIYYHLIKWPGRTPLPEGKADAAKN